MAKSWNEMTDQERSDELNANMDRIRSGKGPDIQVDGKQIEPPFATRVAGRLGTLLNEAGPTRETHKALMARGLSDEEARGLMYSAMNSAMIESDAGGVDRWESVLKGFRRAAA